MSDDTQVTTEEAGALRREVAHSAVERDVAVGDALQAMSNEAEAREDAREQHEEALSAQAEATRSSEREVVAREDAREQHVEVLNAQAEADSMNTLRHLANVRADTEARDGNRTRFTLYLLVGIILALLVVAAVWLTTQ